MTAVAVGADGGDGGRRLFLLRYECLAALSAYAMLRHVAFVDNMMYLSLHFCIDFILAEIYTNLLFVGC